MDKNPHDANTPAWQLWEVMSSNESLFRSYSQDAERSMQKAQAAREKAAQYADALRILTEREAG